MVSCRITPNPVILVTVADYNIFSVSEVPHYYSKHIISDLASGRNTLEELKWIFIELDRRDNSIKE